MLMIDVDVDDRFFNLAEKVAMNGDWQMGHNHITGLSEPIANDHAVNQKYVLIIIMQAYKETIKWDILWI